MNLAEVFIRRPVMTTLLSLALVIFGIVAYRQLPVSDLPDVADPTIVVSASLPGASPEMMASSVATPLERQFSTIAGVTQMTSASTQGQTNITIQFDLTRNLDAAAQDVQSKISAAESELPIGMPSPPSYEKVNPSDNPITYIGMSSSTLPLSTVDRYAETYLGERISMIPGVAQVEVYGSQKYAVRIQLDPKAMASRGIGIDQVADAVRNANVELPVGTLYGPHHAFTVQANGQLTDAAAYQSLIVTYRNGMPVRLRDIGRALDDVQQNKVAGWIRGDRAIVLAIRRQPGTNTVEVMDNIKRLLPTFRAELPASIDLSVLYDRSQSIRASVYDVQFTLLLSIFLVVMVIFLFLRKLSAAAIPSVALPLAIIGTFTVMWALDYTLDNLSLLAIVLSVGFVVDDAIVMLENIVRHEEMGKSRLQAALDGSGEIAFTIVSMTLSLAAVFIPVLFLGGLIGRLLHEFAVTIAAAILVSGFVSLSLTPMLCSLFLRGHDHHKKPGRFYAASERVFDGILKAYDATLKVVLRHRLVTMVVSVALLVATVFLFTKVPMGFLPSDDTGQVFGVTEAAQGISFEAMAEHQQELAKIVAQDPNVADFMSSIGASGSNAAGNSGRIFMRLKPRDHRALSADEIIEELRPKLAKVPGINIFLQNPPPIRIGGQLTKSLYQFTLQSPDTNELYKDAPILESKLRELSNLQDVTSDLQIKNPQVNVEVDRDKASALGVTPTQVEDALYTSFGQRQISTIYAPNNEYRVIMELEPEYQKDPSALSLLYIRSSSGQLVPLNTVAKITQNLGPLVVNHTGQLPSVTISFNLKPGVAIGDALPEVTKVANATLPSTITTSFQGSAQAFQSSLQGLGLLLVMAILVIYIILGILYESFIHPLTILSGLPS